MPDEEIAPYLRQGQPQERLLGLMDAGHAREAHGKELGAPPSVAFRARIRKHLQQAPEVYVGSSERGHRAYLIADPRTNQVAWVAPHKLKRATFFQPRHGVREFVRRKGLTYGADRWRAIDLGALRSEAQRSTARQITSSARITQSTEAARVP